MADVRVRLTPEGVAEVVAALRTVRNEAEKTAKSSVGGNLLGALKSVKGGLATLAGAVAAAGLTAFIQQTLDAAEGTLNLAKAIGTTAQATRQLALAAKISGNDLSTMTNSIVRFTKASEEALQGDPKSLGLFRAIGLTRAEVEKFQGLDTAERLKLVADAFARMADGPAKSTAALNLFGRQFAAILPLLDEISTKGLPDLGFKVSDQTLKSVQALGDQIDLIKAQAGGLAIQFVSGLAPAVEGAFAGMSSALAGSAGAWENFGRVVGFYVNAVIRLISVLVEGFVVLGQNVSDIIGGLASGIKKFAVGDLEGASRAIQDRVRAIAARSKDTFLNMANTLKGIVIIPKTPFGPKPERSTTSGGLPTNDAAKRAADVQKQAADQEIALVRATAKLREEEEQRSFESGLQSLRAYYEARRRIVADAANGEILALQKKRLATESDPTVQNKALEVAKIDGAIAQVVANREAQLADLTNKEAADQKKLAQEQLELDRQIFEARGQQHAAELVRIQEKIDKADELLKESEASPAEAEEKLAALRSGLNQQLAFNEASKKANQEIADFSRDRAAIQDQVTAGLISQADAEARILKLEHDRVDALEAIGQELLKAAELTGDEDQARQAQDFLRQVSQIRLSLRAADSPDLLVASQGLDALKEGLVDLAATGQSAGQSFSQAMAQTATSVVQSLRRIAAQIIATKIITSLLSIFGGGLSSKIGAPGISGDIPTPQAAAEGGVLHGAGTGTSDSNLGFIMPGARPLFFSDGEHLTKTAIVRQPGALAFLTEFNKRGMPAIADFATRYGIPRYAEGGPVGSIAGAAAPGAGGGEFNGQLNIALNSDLLVERLITSKQMERFVVDTVIKKRRTVARATGALG